MIRIAEIHSYTNGNSNKGRSVLCILMSFLMPIVIEMLSAVTFASQREMFIKIGVMTFTKRMFE
jgi:hypothetical protein